MTPYVRAVVRQKHPRHRGGLVPEAENRALRVVTLEDRETVHNAFFDRGFLRARNRPQTSPPAAPPAP
jgi:hypothetical protein